MIHRAKDPLFGLYDLAMEQTGTDNQEFGKLAVTDRRSPGEVLLWNMEGFQKKRPNGDYPSGEGGPDGTRTRDPVRDRHVF